MKTRFALAMLFLGAVVTTGIAAADHVYTKKPDRDYMTSWLLLGPFAAGNPNSALEHQFHLEHFETDFLGGEADAAPKAGDTVEYGGVTLTWQAYTASGEEVDFDMALTHDEEVLAYAYAEVTAEASTACVLALGTNDGCRVWINGNVAWDYVSGRSLTKDQDLIPMVLQPGTNRILIKVEERGGNWGMFVRLLPVNHALVARRLDFFSTASGDNGAPILRAQHLGPYSEGFISEARVRAFEQWDEMSWLRWEGAWRGEAELPLGVPTEAYRAYILRIDSTLAGGETLRRELPFTAGPRVEHVVFEDGASAYSIFLGEEASASEQWAAGELQHWMKEVSGAELPIQTGGTLPEKAIVLGYNAQSAALVDRSEAPELLDESFTYQNVGEHVVILGGKARGTQYGVLTFLERELGVRWYSKYVSVAPQRTRYAFYSLGHQEAPGLRVRNDFYHEAFDPTWAARNKVNGAMGYREQPGDVEAYWSVHTFYPLMPPSEFFEEHPEYYSLINGQRTHDHAQLCLTNPEVLDIFTERIRKVMRENPQYLIYSVSQNDWRNPCQCDTCAEIAEKEGSEAGTLLWFVNQIAERIESEFPDKFIGTLAYQYTRKPPKTIRPRENVVIRLCSIECCFSHDFKTCPENQSFIEDLQGWASIAPHMYIWDYVVNFGHYVMPWPNFAVLKPNIQTLRDNKAIGIMEQAAYQSRGGADAELRAYLLSKLLWNPEADVDVVVDDFMFGYFGRAGQYMRAYYDLMQGLVKPETHIYIFMGPENGIYTTEFIRDAERLFDKAAAVADNDEVLERVERARMPIMYLKCKRMPVEAKRDGTYARFTAATERNEVRNFSEGGQAYIDAFHRIMEAAE